MNYIIYNLEDDGYNGEINVGKGEGWGSLEGTVNKDLKQVRHADLEGKFSDKGLVRAKGLRPGACLSRVSGWSERRSRGSPRSK